MTKYRRTDDDDLYALDGSRDSNIFELEDVLDDDVVAAPDEEEEDTGSDAGYDPDDVPAAGGQVVRYDGGEQLLGTPTRDDLVRECDAGLSASIERSITAEKKVFFMPSDVEETNEYKDGVPTYVLRLYGALADGSKAEVQITDIDVFFDVKVPAKLPDAVAKAKGKPGTFDSYIRQLLIAAEVTTGVIRGVTGFPGRGYHPTPEEYRRVHTPNTQDRKKAINAVREAGLETASDDRSSYYRKAAAEHGLPLSDWAILSGYEYTAGPTSKSPLCTHVFRLGVTDYVALSNPLAPKAQREKAEALKAKTPYLQRDKTLVFAWDIETHTARKTGDVPMAENDEDRVFMICATLHWKDDPAPLRQFCIVDVETTPTPATTTIVCGTQLNVLKAFALLFHDMAPDICVGFNDSNYDWPFVVEKARRLGVLGWMANTMSASPRRTTTDETVMRWNYQFEKKIKISAEEIFKSSFLKVSGCVPIDVRVCFKKLYPKGETPRGSSLKFYLELSKLPGKADMPINRMWRYYEEAIDKDKKDATGSASRMREVAYYCVVDSLRCQQLMVRRNVVNDYREVSSLAFVSLFDSHYYAGGMKVCNLLRAYAWRRNILLSMIPVENNITGKYPGAYVFPPQKGLFPDPERLLRIERAAAEVRNCEAKKGEGDTSAKAKEELKAAFEAFAPDRPTTGLDFASLYPSLIMAYNLSLEKIVHDPAEAARLRSEGLDLHDIEFMFGGKPVRAWSIRHGNVPEKIGLYAVVLIDLFDKRAAMKVELAIYKAIMEAIGLVEKEREKTHKGYLTALCAVLRHAEAERDTTAAALAPGAPPPKISPGSSLAEEISGLKRLNKNAESLITNLRRILDLVGENATEADAERVIKAEYEKALFNHTKLDSKQKALKVYMNTFYGEAGNTLSPLFELALAGGVTAAGQFNIKMVADMLIKEEFRIHYGDSVVGDTPLIVRVAGQLRICRIDELASEWQEYGDKEAAATPQLEVWRDGGFTPVNRVIRHRYHGQIHRVVTDKGAVDCTSDHSLLNPAGEKLRPTDAKVGTGLLHADDAELIRLLNEYGRSTFLSVDDVYEAGLAHGSIMSQVDAVPLWALLGSIETARAYWRGYCRGRHVDPDGEPIAMVIVRGKTMATGIWLLGRRLGLDARFVEIGGGDSRCILTFSRHAIKPDELVRENSVIREWNPDEDPGETVYDLETESGHFHVGPGNLVVHNTDSLYLVCPNRYFAECDADFAAGKLTREEWWAAMVRITMRVMSLIRDKVNAFLKANNGTPYLKMAYEEVIYPGLLAGKKKYFGVPHENEVNFRPKELFIRGIDVVKQGQTGLAREIGHRIMAACVATNNTRTVRRIVEDVLEDAVLNGGQWDFSHFVQTAAWKPEKKNVPVQRCIARMRVRNAQELADNARRLAAGQATKPLLYELPEPNERFKFVIVKTGATFDIYGRRAEMKKGDRMVFAGAAKALGLEIDVAFYMISYVAGLCARFILSDAAFRPVGIKDEKKIDEESQKMAKKALDAFIKRLSNVDPAATRRRGAAYRRAYGEAAAIVRGSLDARTAEVLHGDWLDFETLADDEEATAVDKSWNAAGTLAEVLVDSAWCEEVCLEMGVEANGADAIEPKLANPKLAKTANPKAAATNLFALTSAKKRGPVCLARAHFQGAVDAEEAAAKERLARLAPAVSEIAFRYEADLSRIVDIMRGIAHEARQDIGEPEIANPANKQTDLTVAGVTDEETAALAEFRAAWFTAVGAQMLRRQAAAVREHLRRLKDRRLRVVPAPPKAEWDKGVAAAKIRPTGAADI